MKPGKGSLLALIAPSSKHASSDEDDDAPDTDRDAGDDDAGETKVDAMSAFFRAMKNDDPEAGVKAFGPLCELFYPEK